MARVALGGAAGKGRHGASGGVSGGVAGTQRVRAYQCGRNSRKASGCMSPRSYSLKRSCSSLPMASRRSATSRWLSRTGSRPSSYENHLNAYGRSLGTWMQVVAAWARACIWSRPRHVRLQPPLHHVAGEVEAHGSGVRDRYANAAGCSSAIRRATDSPSTSIVSPPRAARCTQLSTCQHGARSAAERATHRTPRTESEADAR